MKKEKVKVKVYKQGENFRAKTEEVLFLSNRRVQKFARGGEYEPKGIITINANSRKAFARKVRKYFIKTIQSQ